VDSTNLLTPGDKDQLVFIENHDLDRFASRVGGSLPKQKVGAAFNLLLKGIPLIYYGQELGMKGVKYDGKDDGNDIPRREAFEWYRGTEGPGMSYWYKDSGPWWTQRNGKSGDGISLEEAKADPKSLWHFYKTLTGLRSKYPSLRGGSLEFIPNGNPQVVTFLRRFVGEELMVSINLSGIDQVAEIKDVTAPVQLPVLVSEPRGCKLENNKIRLKPFGVLVVKNK
jgi:glycosidase